MTDVTAKPIVYEPRPTGGSRQDLLPSRYSATIQWISMAAFTVAFFGWLNETWLYLFDNPIWLNRYTEYAIILGFGIWRIIAEQNAYTRRRLIVLVAMVTVFWWLIPWLKPMYEPYVGYLWGQPIFPSLHVPGTVTFFLVLAAVFLFGRRVICGWNCPCVGIRETVGFAFRDRTVRSKWAWKLRHTKWFFFAYYVGIMVVTQYPPNAWTVSFVGGFYLIVALTYFGTFFVAPLVGNRFYCRYLCPYGATFGLLNHAGFYDLRLNPEQCNDCRRCEQVCDMGIPVWGEGKAHGRILGLEDCMGCARCVVSCPTDALEIRDVRNLFRPKLVQNGSHLLKATPVVRVERRPPEARAAIARSQDWKETYLPLSDAAVREQAARCLDCGVPGCRNACPLDNRIPDWLKAAAQGQWEQAAEIIHSTNPLPEMCGRLCPQQRLCEGGCTLATNGQAVAIGAIEHAVADRAIRAGWRPSRKKPAGRRVAVVGAGPAGLACAEVLARAGVAVTVHDAQPRIGGLLASGVPPFKLDKSTLTDRRTLLEALGIQFKLRSAVDDEMLDQLLKVEDAVFVGTGAQTPRRVELVGTSLQGVYDGLELLERVNRQEPLRPWGQSALVLGGGDTAMDCARALVRLGANPQVVYRGAESRMRATPREVLAAREEGVGFLFGLQPEEILGSETVQGVRFRGPDDEERIEECSTVVFAFGFSTEPLQSLSEHGIRFAEDGKIITDPWGRTAHPKIYAGGDNTNGPDLVVTAVASGKKAAGTMLKDFRRRARIARTIRSSVTKRPSECRAEGC